MCRKEALNLLYASSEGFADGANPLIVVLPTGAFRNCLRKRESFGTISGSFQKSEIFRRDSQRI